MNLTDYRWAVSELNVKTGERRVFVFNGSHSSPIFKNYLSYREGISFSAFFDGKRRKNRNGDLLYMKVHCSELKFWENKPNPINWENAVGEIIKEGKAIVCSGLYDFYKKIGFNRHTKKYE